MVLYAGKGVTGKFKLRRLFKLVSAFSLECLSLMFHCLSLCLDEHPALPPPHCVVSLAAVTAAVSPPAQATCRVSSLPVTQDPARERARHTAYRAPAALRRLQRSASSRIVKER